MEEPLLAEVAVKEGEDDKGKPDHHDQPELPIVGHLIRDCACIHVGWAEVSALQDPVTDIANHNVLLNSDDEVSAVDDAAHGGTLGPGEVRVCRQATCGSAFQYVRKARLSSGVPRVEPTPQYEVDQEPAPDSLLEVR